MGFSSGGLAAWPLPLGVERANLPLELRHALVGQRRLQAQVLGFLVDARQLLLEPGGVAPGCRTT